MDVGHGANEGFSEFVLVRFVAEALAEQHL
jgi:hypothetical protein